MMRKRKPQTRKMLEAMPFSRQIKIEVGRKMIR
jgi:hypothetical protein